MAVSGDWTENLESILRDSLGLIKQVKDLNFSALTFKDYMTLTGLAFTLVKSLYAGWQVYDAFKEYGVARLVSTNLVRKYGKWAVMAGAEDDIGEAYMTELGKGGMNILVISQTPEMFRTTAVFLEEKYKVKVKLADIDFSDCKAVYNQIEAEVADKDIGILVSQIHLGQDYPQYFTDIAHEKLGLLFHRNVFCATMMAHMVLPGMVERGKGAVVFIGSGLSGSLPTPQLTVYSSIKAYLDSFAQSLDAEYRDEGITIQTLMPLLVANKKRAMAPEESGFLVPSASDYAHQAIGTLGWSSKSNGCLSHTVQSWFGSLIPAWLAQGLLPVMTNMFKERAMEKLGIEEDDGQMSQKHHSRLAFDTSFLSGPAQLISLLGNVG